MDDTKQADPDALKLFAKHLFAKFEGAVTSGMVHLGDRLGLYRTMAGREPATSTQLAADTGLDERWVREWLRNQAAAGLVAWEPGGDEGGERFWLTPEAAVVLADEDSPAFGMGMFHRLPQTMAVLEQLPQSFSSGVGLNYDAFGPEGATGIERSMGPWFRTYLVPTVLPKLDGVVARLEAGATVADVGCGAGLALLRMAEAFPKSTFHGYDISLHALERAEANRLSAGAENASFHDARSEPLPADGSLDLITTFDCIHDMTHPAEMMSAIRAAIAPDGTWLLADIKARDTFAENLNKNPMAAMMYGVSVMSCMSSALSEPGGAGLGTLGLSQSRAEAMAGEAGFTQFRRLDVDHPINAFYEVKV